MGSLIFPESGTIYVDTQILIYTVEKHPKFSPLLLPFWSLCQESRLQAISSELVLLETQVLPIRKKDESLQADYLRVLLHSVLELIPVSRQILDTAAHLRATYVSLRTPDAIHLATALAGRSSLFLTNDVRLQGIPELNVVVLEDAAG